MGLAESEYTHTSAMVLSYLMTSRDIVFHSGRKGNLHALLLDSPRSP